MKFPVATVIMLLMVLTEICDAKTTVKITNDLGATKDVLIRCKSADDDLGKHTLRYKQSYSFRFAPAFIKNTQFYCSFKWDSKTHWFDIYIRDRDTNYCYEKIVCDWKIKASGPCLYITSKYYFCYDWNPEPYLS
ncbi:hypothetical protein M5689_017952 [Euphorbia peplus]|nr:hypothetical protein M5689_017952 [Euphorbia peplus]